MTIVWWMIYSYYKLSRECTADRMLGIDFNCLRLCINVPCTRCIFVRIWAPVGSRHGNSKRKHQERTKRRNRRKKCWLHAVAYKNNHMPAFVNWLANWTVNFVLMPLLPMTVWIYRRNERWIGTENVTFVWPFESFRCWVPTTVKFTKWNNFNLLPRHRLTADSLSPRMLLHHACTSLEWD